MKRKVPDSMKGKLELRESVEKEVFWTLFGYVVLPIVFFGLLAYVTYEGI